MARGPIGRLARRVLRFFAWSALAVALLVGLVAATMTWLMRTDSGREQVRRVALYFTADLLPGLAVGAIEGDFINGLTLHRVVFRDRFGGEAIRCRRLVLRYDLQSLLIKRIHVHSAVLEQPHVLLTRAKNGSVNLAELVDLGADEPDDDEPKVEPEGPPRAGPDLLGGWVLKVNHLRIEGGHYVQRLGDPSTDLSASGLRLATSGVWRGPLVTLQIDRLAARTKLPGQRDVSLALGGRGRLEGERLIASVKARIDGLVGTEQLALEVTGDGGLERFAMDVDLRTDEGAQIGVKGWGGLRQGAIGPYEATVSLRQLDPSLLLPELAPSRVRLQLKASGYGIPPADGAHAKADLAVGPSTLQGWRIDGLKLVGAIQGQRWTVSRLRLAMAQAVVEASGAGTLDTFRAKGAVRATDLTRIPLPGGMPKVAGSIDLKASVGGRFRGRISAEVEARGRSVAVDDLRFERFDLTGSLKDIKGRRPTGQLHMSARGRVPGHIGDALGATAVDLEADLGSRTRSATVEGSVKAAVGSVQLRARAPLIQRGSDSLPEIARNKPWALNVSSKGLNLGRMARVAGSSAGRLGGKVALNLRVGGTFARPTVRARVQASDARLGQMGGLDGTVDVSLDTRQSVVRLDTRRKGKPLLKVVSQLGAGTRELLAKGWRGVDGLPGKPLQAQIDLAPTAIASLPWVSSLLDRTQGILTGKVSLEGTVRDLRGKGNIELAQAVYDHHDLGDLRARIAIASSSGKTRLELGLRAGAQALLRVDGQIGAMPLDLLSPLRLSRAPITLGAEVPRTQLERLPLLKDQLDGVSGSLGASLQATGTVDAPRAHVLVGLHTARFVAGSAPVDLSVEGTYADHTVQAKLQGTQPGHGGTLEGLATVRLGGKQPHVDGRVEGRNFDVGTFAGLVPAIKKADGKLNIALNVRGPLGKPQIGGSVGFSGRQLRLRGMSPLRDLRLAAQLVSDRLTLAKLEVASGKGKLRASGHAILRDLQPQSFDVKLQAEKFQLGVGAVKDGTFDGTITLQGKRAAQGMEARVLVDKGVMRMPKLAGDRGLYSTADLADVVFIDEIDPLDPFEDAPKGNKGAGQERDEQRRGGRHSVSLRADSLRVRGDEIDIEAFVDLRAAAGPQGKPGISGKLGVLRGWIRAMDNHFVVRRATLQFAGRKDPDPSLDVRLERTFPDVTVVVGLSGTASDPTLVLTSEPAIYDESQLLALLLTGRIDVRSDDKRGQSDQAMALASAAMQVLMGGALKGITSQVGIDVARVKLGEYHDHQTGQSQTRAEAELGKHVTKRIYVAYRRVFGADERENENEGLAEFRIAMRWMLMAVFGDRGVGSLDLMWTYRY